MSGRVEEWKEESVWCAKVGGGVGKTEEQRWDSLCSVLGYEFGSAKQLPSSAMKAYEREASGARPHI